MAEISVDEVLWSGAEARQISGLVTMSWETSAHQRPVAAGEEYLAFVSLETGEPQVATLDGTFAIWHVRDATLAGLALSVEAARQIATVEGSK